MRRRLWKHFPIVLVALTVQILAPVATCWAASVAASDPLHAAIICHDDAAATPAQTDHQTGQPGAPLNAPQTTAVTTPYLRSGRVVWPDRGPVLFGSRTGSHAQARAPPLLT
jgi:hypothetical protein